MMETQERRVVLRTALADTLHYLAAALHPSLDSHRRSA
jgi:hypothetical protein